MTDALEREQADDRQPAATEVALVPMPPGQSASSFRKASGVSCIMPGIKDARGISITEVFFKRSNYAIYACGHDVLVQYSDNEEEATTQIRETAILLPLRDRLQFLASAGCDNSCYRPQIADALRLGLEKQPDVARQILETAINDCTAGQDRKGRAVYLKWAVPIGVAATFMSVCAALAVSDADLRNLFIAIGAGAAGALLSITIGIRNRLSSVTADTTSNVLDAMGRLLIGVLSATALFTFLSSGFLQTVTVGSVAFAAGNVSWQAAWVVGFASGFLERLVPDLLEKKPDD